MDILIGLVVAIFIIAAVFVGYHASQEPREEMVEGHGESMDFTISQVNPISMKSTLDKLTV